MTSPPAISVLMPVFNAAPYLKDAVESILVQTEPRFELLLLDDGSSDGSAEISAGLAARDQRMRYIPRPHAGLVATLNEGLRLCAAPLVARMDADDIALPQRLECQLAHMLAHPDCVVVGSDIFEMPATVDDVPPPPPSPTFVRYRHDASALAGLFIPHPTAMMRREAAIRAGGYRRAFEHAEDADLWCRLVELGYCDRLETPLLIYRRHAGQVSARNVADQLLRDSVARALALHRRQAAEPAWDTDEPLTPPRISELARRCGGRAAVLMHLALVRYHVRLGDRAAAYDALRQSVDGAGVRRMPELADATWELRYACRTAGDDRLGRRVLAFAIAHLPGSVMTQLLARIRRAIPAAARS